MLIDFNPDTVFLYLESLLEEADSYESLQRLIGVIDSFTYFQLITPDLNCAYTSKIQSKLDSISRSQFI